MNFQNKRILITGANGLVGIPTVKKCLQESAEKIYAVDIKIGSELTSLQMQYPDKLILVQADLTYLHTCEALFVDTKINIVLHIAGIKGSPTRTAKHPGDYLFPMLMFNTNMIKASFDAKVDRFVYMSSVGVYQPAGLMKEDDVWGTMPSKNDWHPGWAKRMGEVALDALKVQYGWDNWTIIRPSNIYGIDDNFSKDATVISSNIWKLFNDSNMVCWGDGSARRDFVFGDDVAQSAIDVVKNEVRDVINFGCGEAISIKETINIIVNTYQEITGNTKYITWDDTKPNGDLIRCLCSERQKLYNVMPSTTLKSGIMQTITSYKERLENEKN
jgi:GDP-L-fucose synthase